MTTPRTAEGGGNVLGSDLGIRLLHAFLGLLVVCGLVFGSHTAMRTTRQYLPLLDAAKELRIAIVTSHLWLEEHLYGNPSAGLEVVYAYMNKADWYAQAMLNGAQGDQLTYIPLEKPELRAAVAAAREKLREYRALTMDRKAQGLGKKSVDGAGSLYEEAFHALLAQAEHVETMLHDMVAEQARRYKIISLVVILSASGLALALMLLQRRYAMLKDSSLRSQLQARRQAEANERLLATTLESMGDGVVLTNPAGIITYVNPQAESLMGVKGDTSIGSPADEVLVLQDDTGESPPLRTVHDVLATGAERSDPGATVYLASHDGGLRPVAVRATPIQAENGDIHGAVVLLKDITQQKQAEAQALAASQAKSEFLANMSHELRTPISGILGLTDLLLQNESQPNNRRNLSLVRRSAQSLLSIINDILDLAKVESRKMRLAREPFDLDECLNTVLRSFAIQALEKGLDLSKQVGADVPTQLVGDVGRLEQVLRNLLSNAIKFTDKGSIRLDVAFRESPSPDNVTLRFAVQDTGVGIPQDRMGDLFQSFTQLDASYSKKYAGTGLGLAISRELVTLMGGEISAQSIRGQGSTFAFTAVFGHTGQQSKLHAGVFGSQEPDAPREVPKLNVLVAEDDPPTACSSSTCCCTWGTPSPWSTTAARPWKPSGSGASTWC